MTNCQRRAIGQFLSTPSVGRATRQLLSWVAEASDFYPRPPWGGRHRQGVRSLLRSNISIHALRGEGDSSLTYEDYQTENFYPRPPWGGRPATGHTPKCPERFLSTPSVGRATPRRGAGPQKPAISIHALRGEGDQYQLPRHRHHQDFYPRPPWGGRPGTAGDAYAVGEISIHALRGEGDLLPAVADKYRDLFLSTPSVGRATTCRDAKSP